MPTPPTDTNDLCTLAQLKAFIGNITSNSDDELMQLQLALSGASYDFLQATGFQPGDNGNVFNRSQNYTETYNGTGSERLYLRNRPVTAVVSLTIDGQAMQPSSGPSVPGYFIDDPGESLILRPGNFPVGIPAAAPLGFPWYFDRGVGNVVVTYTAGYTKSFLNEPHSIPASPGPYTVIVNGVAIFIADLGVKYASGTPLVLHTAPTVDQYDQAGGTYTFAAADHGAAILISYTALGAPANIQRAVTAMAALIYKRRGWLDEKSRSIHGGGTTTWKDSAWTPEIERTILQYKRMALIL